MCAAYQRSGNRLVSHIWILLWTQFWCGPVSCREDSEPEVGYPKASSRAWFWSSVPGLSLIYCQTQELSLRAVVTKCLYSSINWSVATTVTVNQVCLTLVSALLQKVAYINWLCQKKSIFTHLLKRMKMAALWLDICAEYRTHTADKPLTLTLPSRVSVPVHCVAGIDLSVKMFLGNPTSKWFSWTT